MALEQAGRRGIDASYSYYRTCRTGEAVDEDLDRRPHAENMKLRVLCRVGAGSRETKVHAVGRRPETTRCGRETSYGARDQLTDSEFQWPDPAPHYCQSCVDCAKLYWEGYQVGRARPNAQVAAELRDTWLDGFCHGREDAVERLQPAAIWRVLTGARASIILGPSRARMRFL